MLHLSRSSNMLSRRMSLAGSGFAVQQFQIKHPNRVWTGSLTSGPRREGFLPPWCSICTRAPSDRDRQYAARRDQRLLASTASLPVCSCTGNYWNHVCIERLLRTLKREIMSHRHDATRGEATQDIASTLRCSPIGSVGPRFVLPC